MRKFHSLFHIWRRASRLRRQHGVEPDASLSLRALEQREVARDQEYRNQLEAEEEDRIERLLEKRKLIQERLALRKQNKESGVKEKLIDQVLAGGDFESRSQHLNDSRLALELEAHLRRHRQRERRLLQRWRESLPLVVRQALVLDHWVNLLPKQPLRVAVVSRCQCCPPRAPVPQIPPLRSQPAVLYPDQDPPSPMT